MADGDNDRGQQNREWVERNGPFIVSFSMRVKDYQMKLIENWFKHGDTSF